MKQDKPNMQQQGKTTDKTGVQTGKTGMKTGSQTDNRTQHTGKTGSQTDNRGTQQTGKTGTQQTGKTTNSISFDRCDYDTKQHLLRAQFKQGGNSITCSINEDVLTEIYGCDATEKDLKASFNEHQPQISRALLAKISNKQWDPKKEIQLNVQDLQK